MPGMLDQWGCPVTAGADEVASIEAVVAGYVTMAPGMERHFGALEAGGPMARSVLAMMLTQSHRPQYMEKAQELCAKAKLDAEADYASGLHSRERGHLEAAAAWCAGRIDDAIDAFGEVLADHPTDLLAIRSRYLLAFGRGRISDMLDTVCAARPAWQDQLPLSSFLDGMESFALEEQGEYRRAEVLGRQGVERNETDLWAIHAVAHVLEMERRRPEGESWLDGRTSVLESAGGFAGHIWWHQALVLLDMGQLDKVLNLYDRRVYPNHSTEGLDLSNAVSLLTRLEIAGADVGDRWQGLIEPVQVRHGQYSHPFNDTHYVLAMAKAGEIDASRAHLEGMRNWAARGRQLEHPDTASGVLDEVGTAVAQGLIEYGARRGADAVAALAPVQDRIWMLGGSNAQRGLYSQVLADARRMVGSGNGHPGSD